MKPKIILIGKVLAIAWLIALFIKYIAVTLPISPSTTNALIGVFFPPVVMVLLLIWRNQDNVSQNEADKDNSVN